MSQSETFDFGGWASKNNVLCSDGTTIRPGCFSDQNGVQVPLVWNHKHDSVDNIIGHAVLEDRPEGTYAYCAFNNTPQGRKAKEIVEHGDICALSVFANKLQRVGGDILHGVIREVSMVLAGADPTAVIDTIGFAHGEEGDGSEAVIEFVSNGDKYGDLELYHSDTEEEKDMADTKNMPAEDGSDETVKDVFDSLTDKQKKAVAYILEEALKDKGEDAEEEDVEHSDDDYDEYNDQDEDEYYDDNDIEHADDSDIEAQIEEIYNGMDPDEQDAVNYLVGMAVANQEEEDEMRHSIFDASEPTFDYDAFNNLIDTAKQQNASLKAVYHDAMDNGEFIMHDGVAGTDYGITDIDFLFPDARTIDSTPQFIKRDTEWVDGVLSATHRTPFSRVKSIFANITEDEARAKGYIKGNLKKDQVFTLLKRTTDPQTVYKRQRLDRDDINDITDFNVVAWIKAELQMQLREEIARAILIGDGRETSSDDKIKEDHIRPVATDADLYTIKYAVEVPTGATPEVKAKALVKAIIRARKDYKGTGNPTFYTTETELTEMLLLENGIGERLYKTEDEVRAAIRSSSIVTVEPMENQQIEVDNGQGGKQKYDLAGVLVNLVDYNIGTNGGARTDFFDDFDINYNQNIYLYETRMSGALIKPYSAVSFYYVEK